MQRTRSPSMSFKDNNKIIDEVIAPTKTLLQSSPTSWLTTFPFRAAVARDSPEGPCCQGGRRGLRYYQKSYEERVATGRDSENAQERLKNEDEALRQHRCFCEKKGYSRRRRSSSVTSTSSTTLSMRKITPDILQTIDNARHYEETWLLQRRMASLQARTRTSAQETKNKAAAEVFRPQGAGAPCSRCS